MYRLCKDIYIGLLKKLINFKKSLFNHRFYNTTSSVNA